MDDLCHYVAPVIIGAPFYLTRVIKITKPFQCVRYELQGDVNKTAVNKFSNHVRSLMTSNIIVKPNNLDVHPEENRLVDQL